MRRHLTPLILPLLVLNTWILRAADSGPAQAPTVDVVTSGVGRNETDATKDALSNAVRQAIGAVLSAETMVKNDQVIRDQILTYSDGFVEKYEMVGKPDTTYSGLVSVRIRAQVRRSTLVEKVRAANISVAEVDGESSARRPHR
jgi:hypothetical protein